MKSPSGSRKPLQGKVSSTILGQIFNCSTKTIENLAEKNIVVRSERGLYDLEPSVTNYINHLREQAAGRLGDPDADLDPVFEKAALNRAQRFLSETKLDILKRTLIPFDELLPAWITIAKGVQMSVLSVPYKAMADIPHLTKADSEVITALLHEALQDARLTETLPATAAATHADSDANDE